MPEMCSVEKRRIESASKMTADKKSQIEKNLSEMEIAQTQKKKKKTKKKNTVNNNSILL